MSQEQSDQSPFKKILAARALKIAEEEIEAEGRVAGWEAIKAVAEARVQMSPESYLLMAAIEYLERGAEQ